MNPHVRITAAVAALLIVLAACGDGDDPTDGDPTPTAPTTSTGSTVEPSPTEPTSTVAPATGFEVDTSRFSFRAPEGFENHPISGELIGSVIDLLPDDSIYFSIYEDHRAQTLDELVQAFLDSASYQTMPKRKADTEIDGLPVFHLAGAIDDRSYADVYGAILDGAAVNIIFDAHSPAPRRKEIIESTLATFHWK